MPSGSGPLPFRVGTLGKNNSPPHSRSQGGTCLFPHTGGKGESVGGVVGILGFWGVFLLHISAFFGHFSVLTAKNVKTFNPIASKCLNPTPESMKPFPKPKPKALSP